MKMKIHLPDLGYARTGQALGRRPDQALGSVFKGYGQMIFALFQMGLDRVAALFKHRHHAPVAGQNIGGETGDALFLGQLDQKAGT